MVCKFAATTDKPGGKGIEVGKQYVEVEFTRNGRDNVAWHRYKKAVRSDVHQAKFYFKVKTLEKRFDLCREWLNSTPTEWKYLIPGEPLRIPYDLWVRTSRKRLRELISV